MLVLVIGAAFNSSGGNFDLPTSGWPTRDSAETGRRSRRIGCRAELEPGPFSCLSILRPRGALLANLRGKRARERRGARRVSASRDCEIESRLTNGDPKSRKLLQRFVAPASTVRSLSWKDEHRLCFRSADQRHGLENSKPQRVGLRHNKYFEDTLLPRSRPYRCRICVPRSCQYV